MTLFTFILLGIVAFIIIPAITVVATLTVLAHRAFTNSSKRPYNTMQIGYTKRKRKLRFMWIKVKKRMKVFGRTRTILNVTYPTFRLI